MFIAKRHTDKRRTLLIGTLCAVGITVLGGAYLMANSSSDLIDKSLHHSAAAGKLDGLEIEFWKGGGLPPPNYVSDQLRLMAQGDQDVIEFASVKWDQHFDPPDLLEKWTIAADSKDVQHVARLVESAQILRASFPEERKPNIADCLSYEILLTFRGRQEKRIYYLKLPEQLAPLRAFLESLITSAKTRGSRTVYHKGVQVQD